LHLNKLISLLKDPDPLLVPGVHDQLIGKSENLIGWKMEKIKG